MTPQPLKVTICACTYRRPEGLRHLLNGLSEQVFAHSPRPQLAVVIADNDGHGEAALTCRAFQQSTRIPLIYVHEPQRGISHARNACLDHVPPDTDFIAMIDDDEVPDSDWLDQLIRAQLSTGADVVQGSVLPDLPQEAPSWMKDGFFGWPYRRLGHQTPDWADLQALSSAVTGNTLVRWSTIQGINLRFDPDLRFSGGEDILFFRVLKRAGARIVYAAAAHVREAVPADRATLTYLLRVEYKNGNSKPTYKLRSRNISVSSLRGIRHACRMGLEGSGFVLSGLGLILRSLVTGKWAISRLAVGMLRVAHGLGELSGAAGIRSQHYR